jgi:5-methylcytosine-specific restriction endonuclease McrA
VNQTLVLDVGYQPIQITSWQTAIVWVLDRVVEVVDEHDQKIHTVNWAVPMPSIVRFLKPISRKRAIKFSRHNVYQRDKGRCQYCSVRTSREKFTYDHVVPRAQGGTTCWENVVVACVPCNQRKAGRTPEQAKMRLLSMPVKPRSLPGVGKAVTYAAGMPGSWRDFVRDAVYWDGTLDS